MLPIQHFRATGPSSDTTTKQRRQLICQYIKNAGIKKPYPVTYSLCFTSSWTFSMRLA